MSYWGCLQTHMEMCHGTNALFYVCSFRVRYFVDHFFDLSGQCHAFHSFTILIGGSQNPMLYI